jgi:VanZ family protein
LHRWHYDQVAPNDKLVHFMGYTVLAILPVAFLELLAMGIALAASMIPLGIGLEFAQRLVPGRSFEIGDMVADSLGVIAGMILALSLRRMLRLPASPVQPRL